MVTAKTFMLALLVLLTGGIVLTVGLVMEPGLGQNLLTAIGSTLLTSSVFAVVGESLVRLDTVELLQGQLSSLNDRLAVNGTGPRVDAHLSRRDIDFSSFINSAHGRLRIVAFSANDLFSAPNCDHLYRRIVQGRINEVIALLQDPESPAGQSRADSTAYSTSSSMSRKFKSVIDELEDLQIRLARAGRADALKWYLLTVPVTISLVADDNRIVITPIVTHSTGGTSPTFVFQDSGETRPFFSFYAAHFDNLQSKVVGDRQ